MIFSKYGECLTPPNDPVISTGYFRSANEIFNTIVNDAEERERTDILQQVIAGIITVYRNEHEQSR